METLSRHNCDRTHVHGVAFARCAFPGYRVTGEGVWAVVDHRARHVWCWASAWLAADCGVSGDLVRLRVRCTHERRIPRILGIREVGWRCRDCDFIYNEEN